MVLLRNDGLFLFQQEDEIEGIVNDFIADTMDIDKVIKITDGEAFKISLIVGVVISPKRWYKITQLDSKTQKFLITDMAQLKTSAHGALHGTK